MSLAFIVLSPTFGALILGFLYILHVRGVKIQKSLFGGIAILTPLISFVIALFVFFDLLSTQHPIIYEAYKWVDVGDFDIAMGFMADNLSIFMTLFIIFVGWLIHIYALGYMKDDECFGKFFFYFNLFLASMLLLVLGSSPIIMFIGWEGVGVCSYFLISYYYKDNENVVAGNKAFIANRVGDAGFIIGMCTLFVSIGSSGFDFISLEENIALIPLHVKSFIGIMLFVGAMGKSAQIPLYVWLPDAMAGPTPVSALIHAATMVTAGVYMVARFDFLYNFIPNIGLFIAYIGAFSSLFAAIIATKQNDIKKILAYSTMSQLGYMFVAVGLANYSAGIFHVFTHAFFKALLFMGAGAVIVALHHEQNIFKMGGMKKEVPIVYFTMLIATLAICGIPPFSGFFSKDEILLTAFSKGEYLLWLLGVVTACLTAFYMFRLFFVVFNAHNKRRAKVHSVPKVMTYPLVILALGSLFAGVVGVPHVFGGNNLLHHFLGDGNQQLPEVSHALEFGLMGVNVLVAFIGIFVAYQKFGKYDFSKTLNTKGIIYNKFYVDEFYDMAFIASMRKLSSFVGQKLDLLIIDGAIMRTCKEFVNMGLKVAILQNANVRAYVVGMLVGLSAFSFYMLVLVG